MKLSNQVTGGEASAGIGPCPASHVSRRTSAGEPRQPHRRLKPFYPTELGSQADSMHVSGLYRAGHGVSMCIHPTSLFES